MSTRESGRIAPALKDTYRAAAQRGDWQACLEAAAWLQKAGLHGDEAAEALYALGFAYERLSHWDEARRCYEAVLVMHRRHVKALKRLRAMSLRPQAR